jgi:hypothetical protein
MFQDLRWKTREDWADFGVPEPYTGELPGHLAALPAGVGFTRIELSNLVTDHRWNLDRLRWRIGNTYSALISKGGLIIRLNGAEIQPVDLPLSSAFKQRHIDVTLPSKHRVRGWVGRLDRDATRPGQNRIPGGIRCLYQNRLIAEGEYFGHHAEGKGLLASLIGEIELNFVEPLSNKTDFQRGTAIWEEVERAMYDWLAPIIAEFRRAAEAQPVTLEERKRVNTVREQLQEALRAFADASEGGTDGSTRGRRSPTPTLSAVDKPSAEGDASRATPQPRTPAPDGAVGTLKRLRGRIGPKGEVPPIVLKDLDPGVRSDVDEVDGRITRVVINRTFPMYRDLKEQEAYIAETALLELLQPRGGEVLPIHQFLYQVNDCLGYWYRTSRGPTA